MRRKKVFLFLTLFLAIVAFVPVFVLFQNDTKPNAAKKAANIPLLELVDFRYKELLSSAVGVEVSGGVGYHFKDKDEIQNIKIVKKDTNSTSTIDSKNAVKIGDETFLSGGVKYHRSDGYLLETEKSRYIHTTQLLFIDSPFSFKGDKFRAFGASSEVSLQNKTLGINSVKAYFKISD